jgi:putative nucleotidyltransferase with HDIG domain
MQIINNLRLIKHSIKVAIFSYALAQRMKLLKGQCRNLFLAGLIHDIGKIKLNQDILYKNSNLTVGEFEHIKHHVELGVELLRKYNISKEICSIVEQHHECDDGTGYPKELKENEICIESKILRTADIYDALTSNRSYRKKYTKKQAIAIMSDEKIKLNLLSERKNYNKNLKQLKNQ